MEFTREAWSQWKSDPITKQFLQSIYETREALKQGWSEGQSESERQDLIIMGRCMALKDVIDSVVFDLYLKLEEPKEETNDAV